MLTLHQMAMSGNCYKIRLAAHQLGIPLNLVDYPLHGGKTREPEFLAKNPNGRVPLLEFEDGRFLPESGAILFYLAQGSALWPSGRWAQAEVLQWMFFEQYSHEPYIAVARFWLGYAPKEALEAKRHLVPEWHQKGYAALSVMEGHLAARDWFAGERYSIADIALYAYTHKAHEGGFDLDDYRHVRAWMERVKATPGYIAL